MPDTLVPPPPGQTYLGKDGPSYGHNMIIANSITMAFATVAFALRIYVKGFVTRRLHVEDYLVAAAFAGAIARMTLELLLVGQYQFGQHIWDYLIPNINMWHTLAKIALLLYLFAIACAKTGMLFFYVRLFGINRNFRFLCYLVMFVVVGYCLSFILVDSLTCKPVSAGWGPFAADLAAHCIDEVALSIAVGALNIATDFIIVVLPIPQVLKLKIRFGEMMGILAVLATGAIVVAVAIVRQVMVVHANSTTDFTYISARIDMWLSIELNIGVAGACLPVLAPLRHKINSAIASITTRLSSSKSSRSNEAKGEADRADSMPATPPNENADNHPKFAQKTSYSWMVTHDVETSAGEREHHSFPDQISEHLSSASTENDFPRPPA